VVPKGAKVEVLHYRKWQDPDYGFTYFSDIPLSKDDVLLPRGGKTEAIIYKKKNKRVLAHTLARCSERDNYNKKLGRMIAVGRALKQLETAGSR